MTDQEWRTLEQGAIIVNKDGDKRVVINAYAGLVSTAPWPHDTQILGRDDAVRWEIAEESHGKD